MGRITAYDQYGHMVSDFDKSDYDFLCRYGMTPEEVLEENAKLRKLVSGLLYCAHESYGMCARVAVGMEKPFTCCPIYDFDAREYGCEKLICELRMDVKE